MSPLICLPVAFASSSVPRLTTRETGYDASMGLLWLLVLLLIIFALVGGFAVSNWLFVILVIALILLLVGYV